MFVVEYVQKWGIRIFYVLFLFFMCYRMFFSGGTLLEQSVSYVSYPFLKVHALVVDSVQGVQKKFQTLDALKREVAVSQEEIERLEARVIQLEQELDFQDRTRELVSFSHRYKESFHILSKILMKRIDDRDHLLYLDAGSRKGIHKNMIVVQQLMIRYVVTMEVRS